MRMQMPFYVSTFALVFAFPIKCLPSSGSLFLAITPVWKTSPLLHIPIPEKPKYFQTMQPSEVTGVHYLVPSNPSSYHQTHFSMNENCTPFFQFSRVPNPLLNVHISPQLQEPNLQPSSFSSNSTSDEAEEQQLSLINERRQRRMISNRESARRSRMRKQKHLDELWSQVMWLRNENHQLIDKLNHASESHDRVLEENAQLKEETSELRQMLTHLQLNSSYTTLKDLGEVPCEIACLGAEPSNQSTSSIEMIP